MRIHPTLRPLLSLLSMSTIERIHASERVRKKTISRVELTQACVRRIERLNPLLNAFITVLRTGCMYRFQRCESCKDAGSGGSRVNPVRAAFEPWHLPILVGIAGSNIETQSTFTSLPSLLILLILST